MAMESSTGIRDLDGNTTVDSVISGDRRSKQGGKKVSSGGKHGIGGVTSTNPSTFLMTVTGRIESAQIFGVDDVYCKYNLAFGSDWTISSVSLYMFLVQRKNVEGYTMHSKLI